MTENDKAGSPSTSGISYNLPMFAVKPPEPVKLDKNAVENWNLWKQLWKHFCIVSNYNSKSPEFLKSLLISTMGMDALQIYNGSDPSDDDTAEEIIKKLDVHILGETSETFERYKFNTRIQQPGESIDDYLASLKTMARSCNFCNCLKDSLIRDRIVLGVRDENARKRLLQESKLTLRKSMEICRSFEKTAQQLKVIAGKEDESVHHVSTKGSARSKSTSKYKESEKPRQREASKSATCKFCGQMHKFKKELCPAWGKRCNKCSKPNHFSRCCPNKKLHAVKEESSSESESSEGSIFSVSLNSVNALSSGAVYAGMLLDGKTKVKFQIDSGATVNVLPAKYVKKHLKRSGTVLKMYNNSSLKPIGRRKITVVNPSDGKKHKVTFEVVSEDLTPILSREAAERIGLITINYDSFRQVHVVDSRPELAPEYQSVFDNHTVGCFPGKVSLKVDKNVQPFQCPPRRVPVSIKSKVQQELSDLVKLGVITPVTEPTEWCSQMSVQSKKNGKLRICIDPGRLNEALQRERYPLPTMDDLLPELTDAKIFSKVDLAHGYWHCSLDDDSSFLTTFITPFGRFRWLRLPFGLKVSSEIFQRRLNETLGTVDGTVSVADDILVSGVSEDDHDQKLKNLLQACAENEVKLNKEKAVFRTDKIEFLGHVITKHGLQPDPKKVEAIVAMESPNDVEGTRRLLGMVTYLAKFLPRLSTMAEPIRRLTRQTTDFSWSEEQQSALDKIKKAVTEAPVLVYYDPAKELVIQCDASSKGLGAVLLQDGKPLEYASRALTKAEVNYAQIEKECLAIVFALERFHQYTFGRNTIVHSDHKPLEMIVRKPLHKAPKRLQGMMLRLMQYDVTVVYKKGKEMFLADTLSRAYLPHEESLNDKFSKINSIKHLRIREERLKDLQAATAADHVMQTLKSVILKGWPESKKGLPEEVTPYFSFRDELSLSDGLIFKGERVVVPEATRATLKNHLHISHLGGESMLRRARECVYWPSMSAEIKQMASTCEACQTFSKAQRKETLMPIVSKRPWEVVGVDLFTLESKEYLVTIDYFSGFWEVDHLKSTSANSVINKLKNHFARYGSPAKVISDNGPQFSSKEFYDFAVKWDFEHCTSSPTHSNANGKAESGVKAAKTMLRKCAKSNTDPHLALLEIRNTPTQGTNVSPAQRMMNRKTRSIIPMTEQQLETRGKEFLYHDNLRLNHKQKLQSKTYNKRAKDLPPLEEGDEVRMQPYKMGKKEWMKGTIAKRLDERSYEVDTPSGTFRRNRVHIKPTAEIVPPNNLQSQNEEPTAVTSSTRTSNGTGMLEGPIQDNESTVPAQPSLRRSSRNTQQPSYLKDYKLTDK